jgi:hypothetical protein
MDVDDLIRCCFDGVICNIVLILDAGLKRISGTYLKEILLATMISVNAH